MIPLGHWIAKTGSTAVYAIVATIGVASACSCGDPASNPADAGGLEHREVASADAPEERSDSKGKESGSDKPDQNLVRCEQEEFWSPIPGWKINPDWSCACRLFDPEPGTGLPEWGRWEKCPALGPKNVDCRVIVPPPDHVVGTLGASLDVDRGSGQIRLALSYLSPNRYQPKRRTIFLFDPDGPTQNAMIHDGNITGGCDVQLERLNQGKLAVTVTGKQPTAKLDYGLQAVLGGGSMGSMSQLAYQWDPPPYDGWELSAFVSSDLLVTATRTFGRAAADWSTMEMKRVYEAGDVPGGLRSYETVVVGSNVFIDLSGGGVQGIVSWTPHHGIRPLLIKYGDQLEGRSSFGTDGKDMVWSMGVRKEPKYQAPRYDQYFVMTAPFTTDPAVVASQARVVREEHDGSFVPYTAYRVGCGYAAHITIGSDLVVVRLSDGAQWVVERLPSPDTYSWSFGQVMGVTCDEVFLPFSSNEGYPPNTSTSSIARIRLDSLGEPSFPSK